MTKKPFCALFLFILPVVIWSGNTTAEPSKPSPSPKGAKAYIVSPADGSTVHSPVTVIFGLKEMGVAPAGTDTANTGHHHLLVDRKELPALDKPLGADVIHFGGGQTEVELPLEPGKHTLQLVLGDKYHLPQNPPIVSEKIAIIVK